MVKDVEGLDGGTPATIEVYSGLYVNEASDVGTKSEFTDDVVRERVRPHLYSSLAERLREWKPRDFDRFVCTPSLR